jgi:hypothetical protein
MRMSKGISSKTLTPSIGLRRWPCVRASIDFDTSEINSIVLNERFVGRCILVVLWNKITVIIAITSHL